MLSVLGLVLAGFASESAAAAEVEEAHRTPAPISRETRMGSPLTTNVRSDEVVALKVKLAELFTRLLKIQLVIEHADGKLDEAADNPRPNHALACLSMQGRELYISWPKWPWATPQRVDCAPACTSPG